MPPRSWFIGDALGSVRQTLNDSGVALNATSYGPWGQPQNTLSSPFGFTGELQQGGEVYLRARWYTPSSGRFVSVDPFEGDIARPVTFSPYSYVGNNPVNLVDPSGQCFPPLMYLRQLEPLNCSNLEQAARIWHHPKAAPHHKLAALGYITAWATGHVCALVGVSILAEAGLAAGATGVLAWVGRNSDRVSPVAVSADAPIAKFRDYLFKPGATHGKDAVFRSLGYSREHSEELAKLFEEQALQKYLRGEYVLRKLDQYGQRIDIVIDLSGIGNSATKTLHFISGWMIRPDGISLNTPFSGFPK